MSTDCPVGDYTVKVTLSSANNTELDSASAGFTIAEPAPEQTPKPEPTPEPTQEPTPEPESTPSVGIELSPTGAVEPGTQITVTMTFGGLEADSDTSDVDYVFRADVRNWSDEDADGCEGGGMGVDRNINQVDEDPETRTATVSADCPEGFYTVVVSLSSAGGDELATATAGFSLIEPVESPSLTELRLSQGDPAEDVALSPAFDSATLEYDAEVGGDVEQITVAATASDPEAAIAYLDANNNALADANSVADGQQVDLRAGLNTIKVLVSNGGLTGTYTIDVLRLVAPQSHGCTPEPPAGAIWSACLTVANHMVSGVTLGGFQAGAFGDLSDPGFTTAGGGSYTLDQLYILPTNNNEATLTVSFTADPGDAVDSWAFGSGTNSYQFSDVSQTADTFHWTGTSLSWSDGDVVSVWITASGGTNNAPEFSSTTATRSVAENTAPNTNIGSAITATDADNDTLTYTLEGTDAASFGIVSTSGRLRTRAALDYETKSSYSVTVKAADPSSASDTIDVTINVGDVDEAPTAPAAPTVTPTSGSPTSLDVSWSEPDNTGPEINDYDVQYRAGTTGDFTTWTHTGAGRTTKITGLTASTSYEVQVRAKNAEGTSGWSASGSGTTSGSSALQIFDAKATEGGSMNFLVSLSRTNTDEVTVDYATGQGTAKSGTDFTAKNGKLTFSGTGDGSRLQTITVSTTQDSIKEGNETFVVTLSNQVNATIYEATGYGTILDDGDTGSPCTNYQIMLGVSWEYKTKLNQDGEPVVDESTRYPKPRWRVREDCGFPNPLVTPATAGMSTWKVERRTDWQYTQPGGESEPGTVKNLGNKTPTLSPGATESTPTEKRYNEWLEDLSGVAKGVYDYSYRVCSGSVCSGWVGAHRVWWKTNQYPWE